MAAKQIDARILNKYDSLSNWSSPNVKLLPGEIAFIKVIDQKIDRTTGETREIPAVLMKVGEVGDNGEAKAFSDLPWLSAKASDVYDWAKTERVEDLPLTITKVNGTETSSTTYTLATWLSLMDNAITVNSANISELADNLGSITSEDIAIHNTSVEAHEDIRSAIDNLRKLANEAISRYDGVIEQLAADTAVNKGLIEDLTSEKVNITDIANDLTTNKADKPLGASQGVVLKDLIETRFAKVSSSAGIYVVGEEETEEEIPEGIVVAVFPEEDAKQIDWTNYYTKPEIDNIITTADFKKGKSAYEVAVDKGFEGTEEEWVASLKGEPFTYEDFTEEQFDTLRFKYEHFTPDQLLALKGKPFVYEDFTADQLDALKFRFEDFTEEELAILKGEPFTYEDFTKEQLDDLRPKKGVDYDDGYTPQKGIDYDDGYTPQRGVDYWTESDVNSINTEINRLVLQIVDSAPEALNTLNELAKALGNDPNFATTITTLMGDLDARKVEKVAGKGLSTNDFTTAEKNKLASLTNLPVISKQGYTNEETWYFPLGKMKVDDSGNYGNFMFTGRLGGWVNNNSATYTISLMNRANYTGDIITATVSGYGEVANALQICDIVVSKNNDKSHDVYLACKGYYLFNFEWSAFQHTINYDGTYTTTAPSNIIWKLSTAPKTILSSTGVIYANGKELVDRDTVDTLLAQLEAKIASEYLGGYKLRVASDAGKTGYVTVK